MRSVRFALLVVSALAMACSTSPTQFPTSPSPAVAWKADMHQLSDSLATLLPLTLDPIQFNNPNNQPQIEQEIARLAQFSHAIDAMKAKPSEDPALNFVAKEFSADMVESQRQLRMGNRSYARFLIRNATNYCISCHTQTNRGPQFNFSASPIFERLSPLERANYLFAVRSFDPGLTQFDLAMSGPDVALLPFGQLEAATLKALATAVRVKKDPALADQIVDRIIKSNWAPVYLQLSAMQWKSSIDDWRRQPNGKSLNDARTLLSKSWKEQMQTPLSRSGLIEALRASAILHDLLDTKKPGVDYAETLYTAGLNSEAMKELDLYSLSEFYYESCVRHLPHSSTSRNCFLRLEALAIGNYSAFDSTVMPTAARDRLEELKKMAEPKQGGWSKDAK